MKMINEYLTASPQFCDVGEHVLKKTNGLSVQKRRHCTAGELKQFPRHPIHGNMTAAFRDESHVRHVIKRILWRRTFIIPEISEICRICGLAGYFRVRLSPPVS
jgi:hypothetical protein